MAAETEPTAPPLLQAEGICAAYDGAQVLHSVTLAVRAGEIVAVLGPNGSGKSTLLRCLAGTMRPTVGRALLAGRDVRRTTVRQRARLVAVVPQYAAVPFAFTVWEMVAMGRHAHLGLLQALGDHDREVIRRSLEQTDCAALAERPVTELSGGEMQRVIIARALAQEPQALLLDEPTSHLDINHQLDIGALLRALRSGAQRLAVVWVSHDLNLAAEFCDRIALLSQGRVVADGAPGEVITSARLAMVYGADLPVVPNPVTGRPHVVIAAPAASGGKAR